ncbi:MAG: hypothetical protein GX125_02590 [Bacteroidales bacterium]|jgi:hypothetical protein|nr:neutral/alkaline non-lysosomal ceramidase N-terminal domain-containing protein [Bacteroidota bacterium]NLN99143.1 hypothetical protein [Bacteroidales bacterium]
MKKRVLFAIALLAASMLYFSTAVPVFAQNGPRGSLRAGAAKVDITPAEDELPETSQGILDHIFVRAIVFSNGSKKGAFLTVDSAGAGGYDEIARWAESNLDIPYGNILFSATHTHSSARIPREKMTAALQEALTKAHDNMQPAKLGYGESVSYINVSRDIFDQDRRTWWEGPNYDGMSDKTVAVIVFETLDGKPFACYANYAVHAVVTGNTDMVSGDIPGATSSYVESGYGDDFVACWASGAAGDQNPVYFQQTFDLRDIRIKDYAERGEDISNRMPPGGQGLDRTKPEVQRLLNEQKMMIQSMGQMLGEAIRYAIEGIRRFETEITINSGFKTVSVPGRRNTNMQGRAGYQGVWEDAEDVQIGLALLMIDDIPVTAVNGEVYNKIAVRLKRESPYSRTMMTTVASVPGVSARGFGAGYIPDDESFGNETFEVLSGRYKPGYAESAIVNGLLDLIHEATH